MSSRIYFTIVAAADGFFIAYNIFGPDPSTAWLVFWSVILTLDVMMALYTDAERGV